MLIRTQFIEAFVVLALLSACSGAQLEEDRSPQTVVPTVAGVSPASATPTSTAAAPQPGVAVAPALQSLRAMVEWQPFVVVGEVLKGSELFYKDFSGFGICPTPYTVFSVQIQQTLYWPSTQLPNPIPVVLQTGPEKENCAVIDGGGEASLKPGQRYLFFLEDVKPIGLPGYMGFWAARFELTNDGRIRPNGNERDFAGPAAVSGVTGEEARAALASPDPQAALDALARVTVDEAAAKIQAAIAEGPLPPRPTPAPTAASAPTPTPTPTPQP